MADGRVAVLAVLFLLTSASAAPPYNDDFMEDVCGDNKTEHWLHLDKETSTYGFLEVVRSGYYSPGFECTVHIVPSDPKHHIGLRVPSVDIYYESRDPCVPDSLIIQGNSSESKLYEYCGTGYVKDYLVADTPGEHLAVAFTSGEDSSNHHRGFKLYYTSFHYGPCTDAEFRCWYTSHCIPRELTCDGLDNCGDWTDERVATCGMSTGGIVALSVISVLLVCMCIIAIIYQVTDRAPRRRNRNNRNSVAHEPYGSDGPTVVYSRSRGRRRSEEGAEPPPPYLFYDEKLPVPSYENFAYTPGALPPQYDDITTDGSNTANPLYLAQLTASPTEGAVFEPANYTHDVTEHAQSDTGTATPSGVPHERMPHENTADPRPQNSENETAGDTAVYTVTRSQHTAC